jgi:hypothetical protein
VTVNAHYTFYLAQVVRLEPEVLAQIHFPDFSIGNDFVGFTLGDDMSFT